MKRIILLVFILCSFTYGQFKPFDWFGKSGNVSVTYLIPRGITDTTTPLTPYNDLAVYFTPPATLQMWHDTLWDMKTWNTKWSIQWDMKLPAIGSYDEYIFSQYNNGIGKLYNISCAYNKTDKNIYLLLGDTAFALYNLNNNTDWHTYLVSFDLGVLTLTLDGTVAYTHATTMPNVVAQTLDYGFIWGSAREYQNGRSYGGTLTGYIDNIIMKMKQIGMATDSITANIKFNAVTQQPSDSLNWYSNDGRCNGPHSFVGNGTWFGFSGDSKDAWDVSFARRAGSRKDTCKHFTVGNGGLLMYSSLLSYFRPDGIRAVVKPTDSSKVAISGIWNSDGDSSHSISPHVALLSNGTTLTGLGSGMQVSGFFPYSMAWKGDSLFFAYLGDTAGGKHCKSIAVCNTLTGEWDSLGVQQDTSIWKLIWFDDTLWCMATNSLKAWRNGNWTTTNYFGLTNYPTEMCVYNNNLYIFLYGLGMYKKVGGSFVLVNTMSKYPNPPSTLYGQAYYHATFVDSKNRLWIGGDFDSLGGVKCHNVCYMTTDETIHAFPEGTSGQAGTKGNIVNTPRGFCEWQGVIVMFGGFRYMNNVNAREIAMYDDTRGWMAMDYGTDWLINSGVVYSYVQDGVTYKDLLLMGDFSSAGGLWSYSAVGRYSEAHFKKVKPKFTMLTAIVDSLYKANASPTFTFTAWSPSWRSFTPTVKYHLNYNGTVNSSTATKTDSSLTPFKAVWDYNFTATIPIDSSQWKAGDTLFYKVLMTDDYSNTDSSSQYFTRVKADPTIPLDSLKLAFNWQLTDDYGLGISPYGTTMTSLYNDGSGNKQLTASNVTDSSLIGGWLWFNGSSADLVSTGGNGFYIDTSWTLVIKSRGYANGMIFSFKSNQSYLYSTTGASYYNSDQYSGTKATFDYYSGWGSKVDDSVTVLVSNGTLTPLLYRGLNGDFALRKTGTAGTGLSGLTNTYLQFASRGSLYFKGRIYELFFYNRKLTPTEIAQFK